MCDSMAIVLHISNLLLLTWSSVIASLNARFPKSYLSTQLSFCLKFDTFDVEMISYLFSLTSVQSKMVSIITYLCVSFGCITLAGLLMFSRFVLIAIVSLVTVFAALKSSTLHPSTCANVICSLVGFVAIS